MEEIKIRRRITPLEKDAKAAMEAGISYGQYMAMKYEHKPIPKIDKPVKTGYRMRNKMKKKGEEQ